MRLKKVGSDWEAGIKLQEWLKVQEGSWKDFKELSGFQGVKHVGEVNGILKKISDKKEVVERV